MSEIQIPIFELFRYQADSCREMLEESIKRLTESYEYGTQEKPVEASAICLVAPTGSGKTVILLQHVLTLGRGGFITPLGTPQPTRPLVFIWLAPNRLHQQALRRAQIAGFGNAGFNLLSTQDLTSSEPLQQNTVLFINYGGVNKETNLAIRDNEQDLNLPVILRKTRESGIDIVLIIDEAHLSAGTNKSQDLIKDTLKPALIINATATPEDKTGKVFVPGKRITVDRQDVIDEGVIRKSIYFNAGFEEFTVRGREVGTNELYIKASIDKLKDLGQRHTAEGTEVKPMLMIQIPSKSKDGVFSDTEIKNDSKAEDQYLLDTEGTLKRYGYSVAAGNVALYMSNTNHRTINDLADLTPNNSPVEVLIFKAAAAVGVDLPRAQVLTLLRDPKSAPFAIQTAGRILRQPDTRHYDDEVLNHGYVYTAHESAINLLNAKTGEVTYAPADAPLRDRYSLSSKGWNLQNYKRERTGQVSVGRENFTRVWDQFFNIDLKQAGVTLEELADSKASLKRLFKTMGLQWEVDSSAAKYIVGEDANLDEGGLDKLEIKERNRTGEERERAWSVITRQIEIDAQAPRVKSVVEAVMPVFSEQVNWRQEENVFQLLRDRLIGSEHNRAWLKKRVLTVIDQLRLDQNRTSYPFTVVKSGSWTIPNMLKYSRDKDTGKIEYCLDNLYMFGPDDHAGWRHTHLDSEAEAAFTNYVIPLLSRELNRRSYSLVGYYKQPVDVSSWGIPYKDKAGVTRLHYPDWVFVFERTINGTVHRHLLFLETKSEKEHLESVENKAIALQNQATLSDAAFAKTDHIAAVTLNIPLNWINSSKDLHSIELVKDPQKRNFYNWIEDTYFC